MEMLRENDSEVDCLVSSLATEIKTMPNETRRMGAQPRALAGAKDLQLDEAFLDALADRLATRIFDKAKGIDARGASCPK